MSALAVLRAYRYGRAALSSAIGVAFLVAGLFQTARGGGRGSDLVWFILLFAAGQFFALRAYRRTRDLADQERWSELVAQRQEKLAAEHSATSGPVVGKTCAQCERRIVVAHDGCRCETCGVPLHDGCKTAHLRLAHTNRVGAYR